MQKKCRVDHGLPQLKKRIRDMELQKKQKNYGTNMEKITVGKNWIS